MKRFIILFLIIIFGLTLRTYNVNWDDNQHLHPDERFLTMVANDTKWPKNLSEYLNPDKSPLNPYNYENYQFFIYGTLPLKIVKFTADIFVFDKYTYNNITIIGRVVSALFDAATIFLVFLLAKRLLDEKAAFIAAFLYAISALPIQLSHFFAVDTFLVFFIVLTFYLSQKITEKRPILWGIFAGISWGMALASKITSVVVLPFVMFLYFYLLLRNKIKTKYLVSFFFFLAFGYLSFRLSDPRAFYTGNFFNPTMNPKFISNIRELKSFNDPTSYFPPGIQWITTKPILYPLKNMILWGLGLPLGFLAIAGVINAITEQYEFLKTVWKKKFKFAQHTSSKQVVSFIILTFIVALFLYQGIQFTKALRYIYPIYPFVTILSAQFLYKLARNIGKYQNLVLSLFLFLALIWPLSFMTIYTRPHTRISASEWIYRNIPAGSTISCELWDDCLPLTIGTKNSSIYKTESLHLFDPDTFEKWNRVNYQLQNIDYLILSSNRLWGSIPKVPEKYPTTSKFYNNLLQEKAGFKKIAEFTSYPTIPIVGKVINDDNSEETFTVYDHPKVIIFKKIN